MDAYDAGPPEVTGTLKWPCCGRNWEVIGENLTHVRCPDCGNLFVLVLRMALTPPVEHPKLSKGVWVVLTSDVKTKVGATEKTLTAGEKFKVSHDPYGVIGTPPKYVLVEVHHPGDNAKRVVLCVIPEDSLKLVEETAAHESGQEDPGSAESVPVPPRQ